MNYSKSPSAEKEWRTAEQASSGRSARAPDGRFDQRTGTRTTTASIHSLHSFGRTGDQVVRPSIGRRIFRTLTRFLVTVLIGVGCTLAWQSYGDVAREMIVARVPTLAGLLSPARLPVVSALAYPAQPAASPVNLDAMRRSVEQLAIRQEQMAQNLATLLAVQEDVRQKMSFTPAFATTVPALSQPAAPVQQYRPAQPRARSSVMQ